MMHTDKRSLRLSISALAVGLSLSAPALAENDDATRAAARALGNSGVSAYEEGRFEQASDELEKAYALLKVPSLALWSARALVKRGLLLEAAERYLEASGLQIPAGDATVQRKAAADAASELAALKPRIPSLELQLVGAEPSEVEVTIDGRPLASALLRAPRLVNPGKHEVVATRGADRANASTVAVEGQRHTVELSFPAATAATAAAPVAAAPAATHHFEASRALANESSQRTWGIVTLALGGAGLAVGGVSGVLAIQQRKELDDTGLCDNDICDPSLTDDVSSLHRLRTISTVGFIAGGVLAAAGVVIWATAPSSRGMGAEARLAPNGLLLKGRF
jgi:hypothetical protein